MMNLKALYLNQLMNVLNDLNFEIFYSNNYVLSIF